MLTPNQISELLRIIRQHADHFLVSIFGTRAIGKKDLEELVNAGLIPPKTDPRIFQHAYVLGKLKAILKAPQYKRLGFSKLKELMKVGWAKVEPLTPFEQTRIASTESRVATGIRNITRDIEDSIFKKLQEAQDTVITEALVKQIIKEEVTTAQETRKTVNALASSLAGRLKDSSRDWLRVAATELHQSRQWGTADAILRGIGAYGGFGDKPEDRRVFVQVRNDACKECIAAYTKNGIPKIFLLTELMANGTNIGIKKRLRKPVVPPHHPNCNCNLNYVPPFHVFNDEGRLYLPKDKFKQRYNLG